MKKGDSRERRINSNYDYFEKTAFSPPPALLEKREILANQKSNQDCEVGMRTNLKNMKEILSGKAGACACACEHVVNHVSM